MRFCFAALCSIVLLCISCSKGNPELTDSEMISIFDDHRQDFETLRTMIMEDQKLQRLDMDWSRPDDLSSIGISPERVQAYRDLFVKLRLDRGFAALADRSEIEFIAHTEGLSVAGHAKSYCWVKETPADLVSSIDEFRVKKSEEYNKFLKREPNHFEKHARVYRHVKDQWYLCYDS